MDIENLQIEIETSSDNASSKIDKLVNSLKKLKSAINENSTLNQLAESLKKISDFAISSKAFSSLTRSMNNITKNEEKIGNISVYLSEISRLNFENLASAAENISRIAENLKTVSKSSKKTIEKIQPKTIDETSVNPELVQRKKNWKDFFSGIGKSLEGLKEKFNIADTGFGKLLKTFGRIAMYRAVRTIIKNITQSISEGINNLYQYSSVVDQTFKKAMDSIATSTLYIKNSLATIAEPIIYFLAPIIDTIAEQIANLANKIAALFAVLSGKDTYTKAVKTMKEYTTATQNATKATKSFTLGFDELNVISETSNGVAKAEQNFAEMFQTANVSDVLPDWLRDFTSNFKITFDNVLFDWGDWTGEKIAEKCLTGFFALLGAIAGFTAGGVLGAIEFGLLGATLGLVISSLTFDNDGKLTWEEFWKAAYPGLFGLIGGLVGLKLTHTAKGFGVGVFLGSAVGLTISKLTFDSDNKVGKDEILDMVTSAAFAGVGLLVGGVLGLTIGVALDLAFKTIKFINKQNLEKQLNATPLGQLINSAIEKNTALLEVNADMKVKIDKITDEVSPDKLATLETAKKLIEQIFDLDIRDNKTSVEIQLIQEKIKELNSLGLDGINNAFKNTKDGYIIPTKEAAQELINTLLQQYKMEALREGYINALKAQYEQGINVETAKKNVKEAQDIYNTALKELKNIDQPYFDIMTPGGANRKVFTQEYKIAKLAVEKAKEALDNANITLKETSDLYGEVTSKVEIYGGKINEVYSGASDVSSKTTDNLTNDFKNLDTSSNNSLSNVEKSVNEVSGSLQNLSNDSKNTDNNVTGNIQGLSDKTKTPFDNIKNAIGNVNTYLRDMAEQAGITNTNVSKDSIDMSSNSKKSFSDIKNAAGDVITNFKNMREEVGITNGNITTDLKNLDTNSSQSLSNIQDNINNISFDTFKSEWDKIKENVSKGLSSWLEKLKDFKQTVVSKFTSMFSGGSSSSNSSSVSSSIGGFATGGYPQAAELFFAREGGAPELVGTIGRRTAVANNDQIVESITNGVSIANGDVVEAIYALLNAIEEKDLNVVVGDEAIGQSYDRYKQNRGVNVNRGAFANAY